MAGGRPLPLTCRPFLAAARGHSASPSSLLPLTEPVSGFRGSSEMLLVLLLLPMCWAVEVKRPRGVSLTSESATGGGQRWGWGVGGSRERHLTAFGLSVLVSGQGRWQCSTGGWGERSRWVERASSCPGLSPLPPLPRPSLLRRVQAFHLPGWLCQCPF